MGAYGTVPITAGSGTPIEAFVRTDTKIQQVCRDARATAVTRDSWPASLSASLSRIPAAAGRLRVLMTNNTGGRVYLNFDNTAPTSTVFDQYLEVGDRYEVPPELSELPISLLGTVATGTVLTLMATDL